MNLCEKLIFKSAKHAALFLLSTVSSIPCLPAKQFLIPAIYSKENHPPTLLASDPNILITL